MKYCTKQTPFHLQLNDGPTPPEKVNLSLWKLKNVFLILLTFEAGLSLEFFFQILLESFFMTKPHSFLIAQTTQV